MDLLETLTARCEAIRLDPTASGTTATIRLPLEERAPGSDASPSAKTLVSARPPTTSRHELPKISVELRGTLGSPATRPEGAPSGRGERDLEVLRTLGEGGMGRVFLARQHSLDREVAIKTVRDTAGPGDRDALLAEGAIVGHLEHPGVVPVHALGVDEDGRPVLVMKRVEGAPWSDLLGDAKHPGWDAVTGGARDRLEANLRILMSVCAAIDFAHARGVLHRDVKPQNVLLGRHGEVYLADWGLALRIGFGEKPCPLCGTPAYMAPEMVTGDPVDARTDVYLLGAVLHQVLTGELRHSRSDVRATLLAAAESAPFAYGDDVPPELGALANAATAQKPADRPESAAAVRRGIEDWLRHRASIALGASAAERAAHLEVLLADRGRQASEAWQREVDVVAAEARFAVDQALREWPDNPVAHRTDEALERAMAGRRARAAQLEAFAREHDPNVASRERRLATIALACVGVGLSVSSFLVDPAVSTLEIFLQSLGPLAVVLVCGVLLRRSMMRTVFNRRAAVLLLALTTFIAANRGLALLTGASAASVLVTDCLGAAALGFVASFVVFRWLAWNGGLMLLGAVLAAIVPERAMTVFSAITGAGFLVAVWFERPAATRG